MIENAKRIKTGDALTCDVCVVGAGAAGVTAALELGKQGLEVILLEAGGVDRAGKSQAMYRGELVDPERHLPLDSDRYRQLGGTTGLWGGRCLPFDAIDFEARDYVPYSGWPLSLQDLEPFFPPANTYCECGPWDYTSHTSLPDSQREMIPGFKDGDLVTTSIERWSPPTNFGKAYRPELKASGRIRTLLQAVCFNIELDEDGSRVSALDVASHRGNRFRVVPRVTILAGGGLEVTRLLMASNAVQPQGIGNHADWLGRGYMCHISGILAKVRFGDDANIIYGYEVDKDGVYCRRRLTISPEAQRREGIMNVHVLLDRPLIGDPEHGSAVLSFAFLAKSIAQRSRQRDLGSGKYAIYWRHAMNILSGSPQILSFLPQWCRKRFVQGRRIPSLVLRSPNNTYHLYYHTEQEPNRDCRATLADEKDALGVPRLRLDYRISDSDVESIFKAHELIARELAEQGCGELSYTAEDPRAYIRENKAVLGHHVGTTRMSRDPAGGVVDENCRVHGVSNLYVASSSVFPTSSQANPTLMIVAMTLRLTAHLAERGLPA